MLYYLKDLKLRLHAENLIGMLQFVKHRKRRVLQQHAEVTIACSSKFHNFPYISIAFISRFN